MAGTTFTLVGTVKALKTCYAGGKAFTEVSVEFASDTGTSKAGLGEYPGGATLGGGKRLVQVMWPSANGTLPAVGETLTAVCTFT
jgi:hypothetical protein